VFEVTVSHEGRERLLQDAESKYFNSITSISVWMGVKIDQSPAGITFWAGWGRRRQIGHGLYLVQQTEDADGLSTFLPVDSPTPLQGKLSVPSDIIFHPLPVPFTAPQTFTVPFEEIRQSIIKGSSI
jgi:hypothetical protein